MTSKTWAETNGRSDAAVWGLSGSKGQRIALLGTLALLIGAPVFVAVVWAVHTKFDGSVVEFVTQSGWKELLEEYPIPSIEAWMVIGIFGILQAVLQLYLPGSTVYGPVTPKGNRPVYKANGVLAFVVTLSLFGLGWWSGTIRPERIYDIFGEILSSLNLFAFVLCTFLYIKGHIWPSSTDAGSTGSLVYDFYWGPFQPYIHTCSRVLTGMELYPRIGRHFDIKTWTNCRMGMMGWSVLILCYAAKQYERYGYVADSMMVSIALMEIYIFKFFVWESGYWCSMDIAHDRAGYYICWGCLNWVPGIYTSPALYLVRNPVHLGFPLTTLFLCLGIASIYINYDADRQRQDFRRSAGNVKIWGKAPKMIRASYITAKGEKKTSLLLASGWWGIARHFHYIPEILGAFFWTVPGLFSHGLQYFYVIFLMLLLTDRAYRDDERCRGKYGDDWNAYCRLVPFKLIPGIF